MSIYYLFSKEEEDCFSSRLSSLFSNLCLVLIMANNRGDVLCPAYVDDVVSSLCSNVDDVPCPAYVVT